MESILNIIFLQVLILLIWFNTSAFEEYFKYIPYDFFKIKAYQKAKVNDITLDYIHYLMYNHNCFFVKLITCPICLNVWLSIITCILMLGLIYVPIIFTISLFVYLILKKLI